MGFSGRFSANFGHKISILNSFPPDESPIAKECWIRAVAAALRLGLRLNVCTPHQPPPTQLRGDLATKFDVLLFKREYSLLI